MSASTAESGFGSLLKRGATAVAEITSISGPSISRDTIELTHMESPSGYKEYIGGLADAGEVTIDGNFLPTNATQLAIVTDMLGTAASQTWTILWADTGATTWTFTAFPTAFSPSAPSNDKMSFSATFKISGPITVGP